MDGGVDLRNVPFDMKTVFVEISASLTGENLNKVVCMHKLRIGAFYAELQEVTDHKGRFHPALAFYVTEKLRRLTPGMKRKMLERIKPTYKASVPCEADGDFPEGETILYGERTDLELSVRAYLDRHRLSPIGMFYDEDAGQEDCHYPFLQKALFFAKRRRLPMVITHSGILIDDIRFLNLLSEASVRFHCIDFPWFNHANLELFRALVLYKQK